MEQYKVREDGFKELRKELLMKAIPKSLFAVLAGLAISYFNTNAQQHTVNVYPVVIPVMFAALAFGIYRGIKRQKEIFGGYLLTLDANDITREQPNTPTVTIPHAEIREIVKNSNDSFTIRGNSSENYITIPAQIDNYEKLERSLLEITAISPKGTDPFLQKHPALVSLLTVGLLAAVYISNNKLVVGVGGAGMLALMGYSFIEVQRSKNIDSKTKRARWWLLIVTASLIGIIYHKLTVQ